MSARSLAHVVGAVVAIVGVVMLAPAAVAVVYREWADTAPLVLAAGITFAVGYGLRRSIGRPRELSTREAFAAVGLVWLLVAVLGALPFLLTGSITSVTNAVFESASGFTATGASVVPDPSLLSKGVLFWRALTQWLGGMGMVVLATAILPLLGLGALRLADAEAPGPRAERVTPRFQSTARRLWLIFAGFTVLQTVLLAMGDMTPFEAMVHSFTTLSGGGFSTEAGSLGAFSAYAQWVVIVFMLVGGTSFALHGRGLLHPVQYLKSAEFRLYMGIVLLSSAALTAGSWRSGLSTAIRDGTFTASSILTTTGYATADFGTWLPPLQILIVGLMFVGSMAGSTSGSIKVFRLAVLYGTTRAYLRRLLHPRAVTIVRFGGSPMSRVIVESVRTFLLLYLFAFTVGTIGLAFVSSFGPTEVSVPTIVSAVASCLGNVGPGLELVGPTETYLVVPAAGKWLLSMLMIVGRIEILPIVILCNREAWKR